MLSRKSRTNSMWSVLLMIINHYQEFSLVIAFNISSIAIVPFSKIQKSYLSFAKGLRTRTRQATSLKQRDKKQETSDSLLLAHLSDSVENT